MNTISIETLLQREELIILGDSAPVSTCLVNIFRRSESRTDKETEYTVVVGQSIKLHPEDMEDYLGYDDLPLSQTKTTEELSCLDDGPGVWAGVGLTDDPINATIPCSKFYFNMWYNHEDHISHYVVTISREIAEILFGRYLVKLVELTNTPYCYKVEFPHVLHP